MESAMMRTRALVLGLVLGLAATASCSGVECGEGTFASGEDCVGFDPSDKTPPVTTVTPPGGRSRNELPEMVMLTTDEPAKIFYTTDGSDPDPTVATGGETSPVTLVGITQGMTIKYVAVDRAGNQETLASATFDSDTVPPSPVANMTVTVTGTTASVTWTNPTDADHAGTIVARVSDVIDGVPVPGQTYAAAAMLSPSVQIVSVGKAAQFDDGGRSAGPVRYVAWTFDDVGNYSAPVAASAEVALGSLAAQFTFDTANSTLTRTQSPDNLDLTGTTAVLSGTTLTLSVSLKNNTTKFFLNPKLEITAAANATFTGADGTADTFAFKTLGPNALAPAATVTKDLVFTNVTGTATIDLTFAHHAAMLSTFGSSNQQGMIDLGSGAILPALLMTARGPNDRPNGRIRPSVLTGGRYLDVPNTHGMIERFDLVTRMRVGGANLGAGEKANVQAVVSTGADMFALVKAGGKRSSGEAELIRIDEGLRITSRVKLEIPDDRGFARPALSPDGTTLAVPLVAGIMLLDAHTMKQIDALPSTPVLDLLLPEHDGSTRSIVFFDGANGLFALSRTDGQATIFRRSAQGYTATLHQDALTTAKGYSATLGPDGRIYLAFASGIRAFDPATNTVTNVTYASIPHGVQTVDGKLWVIRSDRINLDQITTAGAVQRTITLPTANGAYGHWLGTAR